MTEPVKDGQMSDELAIEASGLVKSHRDVRVLPGSARDR